MTAASNDGELRRLALRLDAVPADAQAAARLATLADALGREEMALPIVARAARLVGRSPVLWQWTALLARTLDDRATALDAYGRARALAPDNVRIAHGLARVRLEAGLPAEEAFADALALAPLDGEMLLGRASARFAAGKAEVALAETEGVLRDHPGWRQGHDLSARLRWMTGGRDDFTASLDRALAAFPADRALWGHKVALLQRAGLHERALATIAEARRRLADPAAFRAEEAWSLSSTGEMARAEALFAALPRDGGAGQAIRHVQHLLRAGRPEAALARAEAWIGTPDADLLWPYVGLCWRLLGDPRRDWLEGDPRLVGIYDLPDAAAWLAPLAERLRALHLSREAHLDQSVRGGTQTDEALLSRLEPEIVRLRGVIRDAVAAHIAALPPPDAGHPVLSIRRDAPIRFAGSWSVRLGHGGFHASHTHPEGWLSSALYVSLPPSMAADDPDHAGWLALGQPPAELNLDLPPCRLVRPLPGRLVLFPSIMLHATLPFEAGERLTVAFDVAKPRA